MRLQVVLLFALLAQASASGDSCVGRCEEYDRKKTHCQCDSSCGKYDNCCPDYEDVCHKPHTDSCVGRCEEYDRIKSHCQCDMDCGKYTNCCPDYEDVCNITTNGDVSPEQSFTGINRRLRPTPISDFGRRPQPQSEKTLEMVRPARLMDAIYQKTSILQTTPSPSEQPDSDAAAEATTVKGTTAATTESPNPDAVACSGRPFDAFLQQKNGSIYAFRGEYFFELDQKSVLPGYPKLIKDVWGISGPIDAAFTRINCQGKTYIFKGSKYWRFDNGVLDEDYPRDITVGFDRIPDHVDAAFALPAPGHNGRERVYYFKGDQYHMYEFLHQPSHEECVTMSESSPSTLFGRDTDVNDYNDRALDDLFSGLPQHHDKHHFIDKDWKGLKAPVDAAMASRIYTPTQRGQQYGQQWGHRRQRRSPIWESMAERGMNMGQSFAERGMEMGLRLAERRMEMEERLGRDWDQDWDQDRRRDRYDQNNRGNYDSRDDREPIQESQPIQSVYFFKGETYSKVDLKTKRVAFASPPYPRSIAKYWLGCSDTTGTEK